jgi:AcrR family transcriptional regulator
MRSPTNGSGGTKQRVHDAAVRLFAERGYTATGIRDLAQSAGVTSGALYHYMGNKQDLLYEIMRGTIVPILEAANLVLEREQRPEIRLCTLVELHVWSHATWPKETMITDSELPALTPKQRRTMMKLRDAYDDVWREVIAGGIEIGRFDVADEAVPRLILVRMITGIAVWYRPNGRMKLDELAAMHSDLALSMLRARRGRRPIRRAQLELPLLPEAKERYRAVLLDGAQAG